MRVANVLHQPPLPLFSTSGGIVTPNALPIFAHPAEQELARLLSFFGIRWTYEPTTFALRRHDDGTISEAFTPDFFLPDHRIYLELTTMRQKLVTRKNRKARRLRELFPNVQLHLIYRSDFLRLMECYGTELARSAVEGMETPLRTADEIAEAVRDLACVIVARHERSRDPRPIVLVGISHGSRRFLHDLAAQVSALGIPAEVTMLTVSKPSAPFGQPRFRASSDALTTMQAGYVVLAETLVSSGLSMTLAQRWLETRGIAVRQTIALLARNGSRLGTAQLDAIAFEAPNDVLAGYGLQLRKHYANQPSIVSLRSGAANDEADVLAALGIA